MKGRQSIKVVGRFALGGFGIVAAVFCALYAIEGKQEGLQSSLSNLPWLVMDVIVFGSLGAAGGAALGLLALLLGCLRRQPPVPADAPSEGAFWPPPPSAVKPLEEEPPFGASKSE